MIAEQHPRVRFICMRRNFGQTVDSFLRKTRIERSPAGVVADRLSAFVRRVPYYRAENHWIDHSGTRWRPNPVWDRLFPKFDVRTRKEVVRRYCEYYYEEAGKLVAELGDLFRFAQLDRFSEPAYQSGVLSFAGVPVEAQVVKDVHVHNR